MRLFVRSASFGVGRARSFSFGAPLRLACTRLFTESRVLAPDSMSSAVGGRLGGEGVAVSTALQVPGVAR